MVEAFILYRRCLKIWLFLLLCCSSTSCKKESHSSPYIIQPANGNYDKGIAFQEDFAYTVPEWIYYNTDTVCTAIVKFIALDSPAVSYTWSIGNNTYTGRNLRLTFPDEYLLSGKQLPVTLAVRYKTHGEADTTRSFSKLLSFYDPCQSKCNGIFKGFTNNTNHPDSFTINTCATDHLHRQPAFYLENSQAGCGLFFDELPATYQVGYKQILFYGAETWVCNAPSGIIHLSNDTVTISYRSFDNGLLEAPSDHVFKGVRK